MKKDREPNDDTRRLNPDNASHNLDAQIDDQRRKPSRDVADADFAAEAHGFTAFENTGQGSSYRGGALHDAIDKETRNESDNNDGHARDVDDDSATAAD